MLTLLKPRGVARNFLEVRKLCQIKLQAISQIVFPWVT